MKTLALCIVLFTLNSDLAAQETPRVATDCRELVAQVRPGLSEGEEAERYLKSADRAYRDCRGVGVASDVRVRALFKYGIASAVRKHEQAAIEALREAVALFDRERGGNDELLIEILDYAAFVEARVGMRTEAMDRAKRAAELRADKYGANSAEAADGLVNLAMKHVTFKEYGEAESLLRSALRIAEQACGPKCNALVNAYAGMEVLHEAIGDSAEAKRYAELGQNAVPPTRSSHKE